MPAVNPEILVWARKTAGLTLQDAVAKVGISDARGVEAVDRLTALERGEEKPTRPILVKMAQHYRRPLLAFYLNAPPQRDDRGPDFRKKLSLALDWYRYTKGVYVVYTTSSSVKWKARLIKLVKPDGLLFICKLDGSTRQGWMGKDFWEWLEKKRF